MDKLDHEYEKACQVPSDINEHLPKLRQLAEEVDHVTEFGVRWVCSSWGLAAARPQKLICYDVAKHPQVDFFLGVCAAASVDVEFRLENTLQAEIEPTDMLLLDTLHTYDQVDAELERHADLVSKYLVFHDIVSFGLRGEDPHCQGILPAILGFMKRNPEWKVDYLTSENNGLLVLKR